MFERLQGFAAKSANRVTPLHGTCLPAPTCLATPLVRVPGRCFRPLGCRTSGLWQDALAKVASDSVDGILYDTYPLNKEEQHVHQVWGATRSLCLGGAVGGSSNLEASWVNQSLR